MLYRISLKYIHWNLYNPETTENFGDPLDSPRICFIVLCYACRDQSKFWLDTLIVHNRYIKLKIRSLAVSYISPFKRLYVLYLQLQLWLNCVVIGIKKNWNSIVFFIIILSTLLLLFYTIIIADGYYTVNDMVMRTCRKNLQVFILRPLKVDNNSVTRWVFQ